VAMARTIRYGEPTPLVWRGSEHVMVVEGGVDLLSAVVMGTRRTVIGLPGARNWSEADAWITSLSGKHVLLATDDDEAGNSGAHDLQAVLKGLATTRRYQHRAGCKDLNDQLRLESGIK
jgi:hypothetical protein